MTEPIMSLEQVREALQDYYETLAEALRASAALLAQLDAKERKP